MQHMRTAILIAFLVGWWPLPAQDHSLPTEQDGPVYGSKCGYGGAEPLERILLERLVRSKDQERILGMLKDSSYVIQAYGTEGVIRLQQQGVSFSEATISRIAKLRKSKVLISTCSGCMFQQLPLGLALEAELRHHMSR